MSPRATKLPEEVIAATIRLYGGLPSSDYNGLVVNVGPYLAGCGMFETYLTETVGGPAGQAVGDVVHAYEHELEPINTNTVAFMHTWTSKEVALFSDEEWDLAELLTEVGVRVEVESISTWSPAQYQNMKAYATAVLHAIKTSAPMPPKPKELT